VSAGLRGLRRGSDARHEHGHSARQVFDLPEPTPLAATVRSKKPDFAVGLLRYYLLIK
jgi:hypothetical protein